MHIFIGTNVRSVKRYRKKYKYRNNKKEGNYFLKI